LSSYVEGFQRGLTQAWNNFLDGNEPNHIYVQGVDGGGKSGTSDINSDTNEEL